MSGLAPVFPATVWMVVVGLIWAPASGHAQSQASRPKRIYRAERLTEARPTIDGRLDDACWQGAGEWSAGFTQLVPDYAAPATRPTEIKICYDAHNVYVAMRAYDGPLAERSRQAGDRDAFVGDIMGVNFDSYHDQRTGFEFDLTASGQKIDLRLANDGWDTTWNAVWEGKVAHEADCWTAEFLVPLSQLRFDPKNDVWGLHAWRWIDRLKEESDWNLLANDDSGLVKSFGELHGLTELRSARRLEVLPYASLRVEHAPGGGTRTEGQGGLDVKYGLTSNITLDASIRPDFGQVEADPAVMNLTAFETFLTEKRPLFLEGNNIFEFTFGDDVLFYSRRIGQPPVYRPDRAVGTFPETTTLLGALKVSGKTGQGLSFGVLAAMTDEEVVQVDDGTGRNVVPVAPRAAQLVVRAQQDFREGDTVVGGLLTAVRRDIGTAELAERLAETATVAGLDLSHYWADREYRLQVAAVGSAVLGEPAAIERLQLSSARYFQRPMAGRTDFDPTRDELSGSGLWLKVGKASQGHWRWHEELEVKSAGLELNDLGFLAEADRVAQGTAISYVVKEPRAWYRSYDVSLHQSSDWTTRREHLGTGVELSGAVEFVNKWNLSGSVTAQGEGNDPVALRGGPMLRLPAHTEWWTWLGTDGSKAIVGHVSANGARARQGTFDSTNLGAGISVRPWTTLLLEVSADVERQTDRQRFLEVSSTAADPAWFVSRLRGESRSLSLRAEWNLRPELSLQYFGNPFGLTVRNTAFRQVIDPGARELSARLGATLPATWTGDGYAFDANGDGVVDATWSDPDFNYASFRSNLVLKWEYRRGSMLYLVWAQQREGAAASKALDAWTALRDLRDQPATNQFLVKLTYWFSS